VLIEKKERQMKYVFGMMIAVGFFLVLGVAGSDCDGKCMENSMPIADVLMYSAVGIVLMLAGVVGIRKV